MKMATLYEMSEQARLLYDLLQADEIDEQTFIDTLDAMGAGEKIESYCQIVKQMQADAEMYGAEMARLKARKKTAENGIERLRDMMALFLVHSGQDKVKAGIFTVSLATTKSLVITDETKIPARFLVEQPPKIDTSGIRAAIKAGENVDGAFINEVKGVRIR